MLLKRFTMLLILGLFTFAGVGLANRSHHSCHHLNHSQKHNRKHNHNQTRANHSESKSKNNASILVNSSNLDQGISRIIKYYDPNISVGIQVQSMTNGQIIYRRDADRLFMPASTLKIFTAAAALKHLNPGYKFKTAVLAGSKSTFANGLFKGDMYFYFDGDPILKRQNLENLVATLQKAGIRKIKGNIIIDDSIFKRENYGPGWMWDEENLCYAAPISAINIDKNCLPFKIVAAKEGKKPQVTVNGSYNFVEIVNSLQSKPAADQCPLKVRATDENFYHLSGCISPRSPDINLSVSLKNVRLYAARVLADLFIQNKIEIIGKIGFAPSPRISNPNAAAGKDYYILAQETSPPLRALVKAMLKKSDNLIADALFKKLGFSYSHKSGSWLSGAKALRAILAKNANIDFSNTRIVDGSGLSHYNLLSPAKMSKLLNFAYHDPEIKDAFYDGLPISGIDGSLAYRLSVPGLVGKVHAKTGTMKGILSLAGYLTTDKNKRLSFVIMINDFVGSIHKYRQMEDAICAFLIRNA